MLLDLHGPEDQTGGQNIMTQNFRMCWLPCISIANYNTESPSLQWCHRMSKRGKRKPQFVRSVCVWCLPLSSRHREVIPSLGEPSSRAAFYRFAWWVTPLTVHVSLTAPEGVGIVWLWPPSPPLSLTPNLFSDHSLPPFRKALLQWCYCASARNTLFLGVIQNVHLLSAKKTFPPRSLRKGLWQGRSRTAI